MDRESQISALQADLLSMVADHLTSVALRYGYSDVPLETNIKWRPQVLVIGNYSSGKSTLIKVCISYFHYQRPRRPPLI